MNFFFLHWDVLMCAIYHADKHLNKMVVEYAQLASTCWHALVGEHGTERWHAWLAEQVAEKRVYRVSHVNHPTARWLRRSRAHYLWVVKLGIALTAEKQRRMDHPPPGVTPPRKWKRDHATRPVLDHLLAHPPPLEWFPDGDTWSDPPKAMPEWLHTHPNGFHRTAMDAYRMYYATCKVWVTGVKWEPYAPQPHWVERYQKRAREDERIMEGVKRLREK